MNIRTKNRRALPVSRVGCSTGEIAHSGMARELARADLRSQKSNRRVFRPGSIPGNFWLLALFALALPIFLASCASLPGRRTAASAEAMARSGNAAGAVSLLDTVLEHPERLSFFGDRREWIRSAFLRARFAEREGRPEDAVRIYHEGMRWADRWKAHLAGGELRHRALFLFGLCRNLVLTGNRAEVDRMTRCLLEPGFRSPEHPYLADLSPEERYYFLKNAFSIAHIFFTGDHRRYLAVMTVCKELLNRKDSAALRLLHPVHYLTDVLMDEVWVDLFIAYANLQSGDPAAFQRIQETYESMYENPAVRSLLWGADVLNLYPADRAILFGFGGYGYALLGRYRQAGEFFRSAVESLEGASDGEWRHRVYLGGLKVARADAYFIPVGQGEAATRSLGQGIALLESTRAAPWAELLNPFGSWCRHWLLGYARMARAKFHFQERRWDTAFRDAREALALLDRSSPKQLVIDAAFYAFLAGRRMAEPVPLAPILDEVREKLMGYKGYERWKIQYLESLHRESTGDRAKALKATMASAATVEKFRRNRFPGLIQQVTFMEDKGLPYQRWIRLLLDSDLSEAERTRRVFAVIEENQLYSLGLSEIESPAAEPMGAAAVQATLSPRAAMVQLYYGNDFLLRILLTREKILLQREAVSAATINERVREFRRALSPLDPGSSARRSAATGHELYRLSLAPLVAGGELDGKTELFIVPHRDLHYVAWNALPLRPSPGKWDYLFDRWTVSVLPASSAGGRSVFAGDRNSAGNLPQGTTLLVGPNIPASILSEEISEAVGIRVIEGVAATVPAALRELKTARHLLFLAHGHLDRSSPLESAIQLNGSDGEAPFTLSRLREAEVSCEFVSLTGCSTGMIQRYSELDPSRALERFPESGDLLGLYKTLIAKGVRHVSVSILQELDQFHSEIFMARLSRELRAGRGVPESFRRAVAEVKSKDPDDPYFWGGYLLVGR